MSARSAQDSTRVEAFASQLIRTQGASLPAGLCLCDPRSLIRVLQGHGPATVEELAAGLGCSLDAVRAWLCTPHIAQRLVFESASRRFALRHGEAPAQPSPESSQGADTGP